MADYTEEWRLLEQRCDAVAYDYRPRLIDDSYRSRVNEMRAVRRKARKESRLYEIYDRMSNLPDATQFVTRDLFSLYLIPEEIREMYVRTHRVVGPGALATYDFAVIYRSPENLCGPTDFRARANGSLIIPLAMVLCYPDILQGKLTAAEILQLRRRAAVDPNSAAIEAQNYIRRKSKGKEVVVVGEMNRSVKECCRLLDTIANHVSSYNEPIESMVEGNWLQLFGPNGIRDWSISAPLSRASTLKNIYRMLIVMGCDVVKLLFENELSLIGAVLVAYGEACSEPRRKWTPCANDSIEVDFGSGNAALASPPLSDELIKAGETETMCVLTQSLRLKFESRKTNVIAVKSRRGTSYGNAVDLGGNALVTCSHVADAVMPGFYNHLAEYGHTQHLCLLDSTEVQLGEWPVREPAVGELATYVFVVDDEVRFSAPVAVLRLEDDHVITSANPVMGKGRSGAALVSLTDLSLLGLFTAKLDDLLVAVVISPTLRKNIYSVTNSISRQRCDDLFRKSMKSVETELVSAFMLLDDVLYLNHPNGILNCSSPTGPAVEPIDQVGRLPAMLTCRDPVPNECCRVYYYTSARIECSELFPYAAIKSSIGMRVRSIPQFSQWCPIISELDRAVLGFKYLMSDGTLSNIECPELRKPELISVLKGQESSSLASIIGDQTVTDIKEDLLSFISGKLDLLELNSGTDDELIRFPLMEWSEERIDFTSGLLDYEFYLEIVGERAINATYIELSLGEQNRSNFVGIKRKFVNIIFEFIRNRLGRDVLSALIQHVEVSLILEPT